MTNIDVSSNENLSKIWRVVEIVANLDLTTHTSANPPTSSQWLI
jgi:hypothetical protein